MGIDNHIIEVVQQQMRVPLHKSDEQTCENILSATVIPRDYSIPFNYFLDFYNAVTTNSQFTPLYHTNYIDQRFKDDMSLIYNGTPVHGYCKKNKTILNMSHPTIPYIHVQVCIRHETTIHNLQRLELRKRQLQPDQMVHIIEEWVFVYKKHVRYRFQKVQTGSNKYTACQQEPTFYITIETTHIDAVESLLMKAADLFADTPEQLQYVMI